MEIIQKYTLQTNDIIYVGDTKIVLYPIQVSILLDDMGITFFECEYSDEYYFINATKKQINKLKKCEFVEWVELYDEKEFKFRYITTDISTMIDNLEYKKVTDELIEAIVLKLNNLKKLKNE